MAIPKFYGNLYAAGGPYFDVTYYGAVGDGTTDDSTAFTNAMTAANAVKGTVLVPPPAVGYVVHIAPQSNVTLLGIGVARIIPKPSSGGAIYQSVAGLSNISNFGCVNLTFDANSGVDPAVFMSAEAYTDCFFVNCTFKNLGSSTTVPMVQIGKATLPTLPATRNATSSLRMTLDGCDFVNNNCSTREGALLIGWADSLITDCKFIGNTCVGAGVLDLYAYCDHVIVDSCIFSGNVGSVVGISFDIYMVSGTHLSAINCTHSTGSQYTQGYRIANCNDVLIAPVTIEMATNAGTPYSGVTGLDIYDNTGTFDGNTVLYANTTGVTIRGGCITGADIGIRAPALSSGNTAMNEIIVDQVRFANLGSSAVIFGGVAAAAAVLGVLIDGIIVDAGSWAGPAIDLLTGTQAMVRNCLVEQSASAAYCVFLGSVSNNAIDVSVLNCDFSQWSGTGAHPAIFQTTAGTLVLASGNRGYNPKGAVTITPSSHAWHNTTGSDVLAYVGAAGSYTGTTTITPSGGSAVTVPNAVVGMPYLVPSLATLTWGVGGSVSSDPTFNGFGN